MGKISIGTASWAEKSLIDSKLFYPPEVDTAEERLRYYASQFSCVELDSSYYGIPTYETATLWVDRTPDDFTFDVKAYRLFTMHQTPLPSLPRDIREALGELAKGKKNVYYNDLPEELRKEAWQHFFDGVKPLRDAGKLGYVLLQFPPWFFRSRENVEHVLHCADVLDDYTVAVEFRQGSWFYERTQSRTLSMLRENGMTLVIVDEPQGSNASVPFIPVVTNPKLSVVRLHGRNAEKWTAKGLATSAERFDYQYSEKEMREFLQPFETLADEAEELRVYFNNSYRNYAQVNAKQMQKMVKEGLP